MRTAAACLSRCIRHRRRSKAKPLRGRRGRYRATPQIQLLRQSPQNRTTPSKCVRTAHTPKTFCPQRGKIFHTRKARISPPQSGDFTRQRSCRISLSARAKPKHERQAAKEPRFALRKATVMRTRILSVTPVNPLGVTAPLINKGSQENGVNAMPCRRYNPSVKPTACQLPLHRGAENALNLPLRHRPLKMCAHGAHT